MSLLDFWQTPHRVVLSVQRISDARLVLGVGVLLVVGLAGLSGCASTTDDSQADASFEPVTRFVGTLPCADCRVIRADLTLHRDAESGHPEKYFLQQTHVDAIGGDFTSTLWGDWRLVPTDEDMYYRIEGHPRPIVLRIEEDGQRLGWVGVRESRDMENSYELTRAEPLR